DHQVHVEEKAGLWAQRLDEAGAEGYVGDEAAVHHVKVQPIRALYRRDRLRQVGKVRREERRGDFYASNISTGVQRRVPPLSKFEGSAGIAPRRSRRARAPPRPRSPPPCGGGIRGTGTWRRETRGKDRQAR